MNFQDFENVLWNFLTFYGWFSNKFCSSLQHVRWIRFMVAGLIFFQAVHIDHTYIRCRRLWLRVAPIKNSVRKKNPLFGAQIEIPFLSGAIIAVPF